MISELQLATQRLLKTPYTLAVLSVEQLILSTLQEIKHGSLNVIDTRGEKHSFGEGTSQHQATIQINSPNFWLRVALFSALGLGEAYMYNEFSCNNLQGFLMILALNRDLLASSDGNHPIAPIVNTLLNNLFTSRISNSIMNSLSNISAHYDLGNEMFECFLDKTMTYSCPIWQDEDEPLEQAQLRKIHSLLDRAYVKEGHFILEIGTGWGALAIEAARRYKCKVVTITLSVEQQKLAQDRIKALGLEKEIKVLLTDYRALSPKDFQFDRIISCEMIEAVGPEFLVSFFQQCNALLKPDGVLSMQAITMPEARYPNYLKKTDFIQKHIFPGGHCPSVTALIEATNTASLGNLALDDTLNIGPHYAKALRIWNEKFTEHFDAFALRSGDKHIYTPEFKRKWQFYFSYCNAGFATRTLGVHQLRFTRPANQSLISIAQIPL